MPTKSKTTEKAPTAEQRRAPQPDDKRPNEFEQGAHPTLALQRAKVLPASALKANDILALQRSIGNRAVQRLLSSQAAEPPAAASSAPPIIQAKLMVGPAGDHYEQEADRIAQKVTSEPSAKSGAAAVQRQTDEDEPVQRKPLAASITPLVQRQQAPDEDKEIQTKRTSHGEGFAAGGELESRLQASRGSGSPLPDTLRSRMEQSFGASFENVRIHHGDESDRLNRSLQSRAFTTGQDLFFKRGEYNPSSPAGRELIAHELSHVVQQSSAHTKSHMIQRRVITEGADQGPVGDDHQDWKDYKDTLTAKYLIEVDQTRHTRENIIKYAKTVETEKKWHAQEQNTLAAKPRLLKQLETEWGAYTEAVNLWAEYPTKLSEAGIVEKKKEFRDEKAKWANVEANVDSVEKELQVVHGDKSAELKPYQDMLDGLAWRQTYATQLQQKARIRALRDVAKPEVDKYAGTLADVAKSKAELETVKLSESDKKIGTAREKMQLAKANKPARNLVLKQTRQKLGKLIKRLDKVIPKQLKEMIDTARDDDDLDVAVGEVKTITDKMIAAKLPKEDIDDRKDTAKKRIKDAVKLQHNPTRTLWYEQFGVKGDSPAMGKAGTIAGDPVHDSVFNQPAFKEPSSSRDLTAVSASGLKNDLLSNKFPTGYHLTIDQKRGVKNHPHAFRGEKDADMRQYLVRPSKTFDEAKQELIDKRNNSVDAIENLIENIHTDKGKGINKKEVQKKLTH